jgi:hypothetical protein
MIAINSQCIGHRADGESCKNFPIIGGDKCRDHAAKEALCQNVKCRKPKLTGLDFCETHAPKKPDGELIGIGSLPLTSSEELILAMADTANKVRMGLLSPSAGSTIATLLGKIQDAFIERDKADPRRQFTKQFIGEAARLTAATMTLEQAKQIAQNRSPHLVAQALESSIAQTPPVVQKINDEIIAMTIEFQDKITELSKSEIDEFLGDDV